MVGLKGEDVEAYWRSFDHGDGFHDLLLVHLGSRAVEIAYDCRHAGFVSHSCSKMDGLLGIVLGEGLDLASVAGSPLTGQKGQRAMTGRFELSVRHLEIGYSLSMSRYESRCF